MGDKILCQQNGDPSRMPQYALSLPTSVVITGIDSMPFSIIFEAANTPTSSQGRYRRDFEQTAHVAMDGKYEPAGRLSVRLDGCTPQWLGYNPPGLSLEAASQVAPNRLISSRRKPAERCSIFVLANPNPVRIVGHRNWAP